MFKIVFVKNQQDYTPCHKLFIFQVVMSDAPRILLPSRILNYLTRPQVASGWQKSSLPRFSPF